MVINFYNSNPKVTYQFSGYPEFPISPDSCVIRSWKPYGQSQNSSKNLGNFVYSSGSILTPNSYIIFPQDSRRDCHILVGVPNLNQDYVDTRNGDITLNVTIEKDVSTPNYSQMLDFPTRINIKPLVTLIIDSNKTLNFTQVISNEPETYLEMNVENDGRLILYANSKIIIRNKNRLNLSYNSRLYLGSGAEIIVEQGGLFCNLGALIRGKGHIVYKGGSIHHIQCYQLADYLVKDSTKFILDSNAVLEFPDSTILRFSGPQSGLIMKPNSKLKLGEGSKIIFDSSASLIANGATFTSIDSSLKWDGIVLNNSDADTITNCTFSNAVTALTIRNDANASYKNRIITGNTFNIPSGGNCKGIYGENNYRILIKNNTFNMPVYNSIVNPPEIVYVGIYLKNSSTGGSAGETEENEESPYSLNIVGNTISNGCASIILANYLSNLLPYNINNNTFNDAATVNLIGMQITGRIKNNNFTSDNVPLGIHLISSDPELYNNSIESKDVALHLSGHCYPKLGPYLSGSDMLWAGGNNSFSSMENDNIQLSSAGILYSDWGNNSFNVTDSSSYHIFGFADSALSTFYARDNCWNNSGNALLSITKYNTQFIVPTVYYNVSYECNYTPYVTGWNVHNLGNGIYDSTRLTENITGYESSEEEILLYTALNYSYNQNFPEAIAAYKSLIETDTSFALIATAVDFLYSNYQALDTSSDQNYRNDLYSDLIIFLEPKVISEEYPSEFNEAAYEVILMCYANIGEYVYSQEGYGLLALYHPDPNIRLEASWNYAEIEDLISSGEGGGEKQFQISNDKLQIEKQKNLNELKELNKLNELISDDPVMSKMKRSFEKTSIERKDGIDKKISSENRNGKIVNEKIIRSRQIDLQKEDRAKRNIFDLRNLKKEEKEKRRMEDMALTTLDIRNEFRNDMKVSVPDQYRLEQNYPNPFNPVTNLEFGISKVGFVTLKVYDILGKEVKALVNEIKQPGIYKVVFDGSNLASGIYFYKIEAGSFVQTKRMILLK